MKSIPAIQKGQRIYLVSGDVPLLLQDACQAIRSMANQAGFTQRERLYVERGFDWNQLYNLASSLSLFGDKTLIELYHPTATFEKSALESLKYYLEHPPSDKILLLMTDKLSAAQTKTAWYTLLSKAGQVIRLWPPKANELPAWVQQQAQVLHLKLTPTATQLLIELTTGHLLAARQALEKLTLLFPQSLIDTAEIAAVISPSSRYQIFDLSEPLLTGQPIQILRILNGLQGEAVEPTLVLWLLTRELRLLLNNDGKAPSWSSNQAWQSIALRRLALSQIKQYLLDASLIDRIIKGYRKGDAWIALKRLALAISGQPLFPHSAF